MRHFGSWIGCLLLAACSIAPARHEALDTAFLALASDASVTSREALWQLSLREPPGLERDARLAWLMGLPGHVGYDPAAAAQQLRDLQALLPPGLTRSLFAQRAPLVGELLQCRGEALLLRERLERIVEIERTLQDND